MPCRGGIFLSRVEERVLGDVGHRGIERRKEPQGVRCALAHCRMPSARSNDGVRQSKIQGRRGQEFDEEGDWTSEFSTLLIGKGFLPA